MISQVRILKTLIKEFYKLKNYFFEIKQQVEDSFQQELESLKSNTSDLTEDNSLSELNFYLHKIAALNKNYNGEYSLKEVKKYYHQLIIKQNELYFLYNYSI